MTLRPSSLPRLLLVPALGLCVSAVAQTPATPTPAPTPVLKSRTAAPDAAAPAPQPDRSSAYYHFGLAKMYEDQALTNGRQDLATQAIEQYKLAQDADPNSPQLADGLANLYFRLGRIREAVSTAEEQIKKHPDDVDAHTLLGRVYLRSLGDGQGPQSTDILKAAIKEYETIAHLKPDDLETHLLLGQLYGLNHDSANAEAQFKEAQRIDGTSEEVVLSIARLYSEQGQFEKAAKAITAVPVDDRTSRMDFALAGLYHELKQPKQAAAAYQSVLDQDPDNADAKRGLAEELTAAGQIDAASKVYSQILGSDPQDVQALISESNIERQQGHYEQALATLKKAEPLVSDNQELSYDESLCYDALGRYDEAIHTLTAVLASTASKDGHYADADLRNRALFLERLGIVQRESGKTAAAIAAFDQMAALGGDLQSRAIGFTIDTYRDAHQYPEALKAAEAAVKLLPANHDLQLTYASQLADAGKLDEAIKVAQAQLAGTPDDKFVDLTLFDIYQRARRWKEASAALDKAEVISTEPGDKINVDVSRGMLADRQKLYDQAEIEYRKGLVIDPQNATIENDLGYMLAERGTKLDEAVTMLKKAVEYDPQNYAFLDSLAWAYYKQGQYALAEDFERKAVQRMAYDPTLLDHLGEIYAKTGKLQMAIAQWEKSLKMYAASLPPEADPTDVDKVQHKLEGARVRLAHAGTPR
jgi:tetratricopeptide (TPR) repeat protein